MVADTPETAAALVDEYEGQFSCIIEGIEDGALDDDEFEVSEVRAGPASFAAHGDHSTAYRAEIVLEPREGDGAITVVLDVVVVQQGRMAFSLQTFDIFSPFDSAILEELTQTAAARAAEEQQ